MTLASGVDFLKFVPHQYDFKRFLGQTNGWKKKLANLPFLGQCFQNLRTFFSS
jgi:hypothetical protein